jgi:hypothetical protein
MTFTIQKKQLEFIPGLFLSLWGLWVLSPWWETFHASSAYVFMNSLAPEWVWGLTVMLIGLFQLFFVFKGSLTPRMVMAGLSMFACFTMMVLYAFGDFRSTGVINMFVFGICAWLGYMEILADMRRKGRSICK